MYVIAGVTGNTGSVVANELLAAGAPVRVIVRDAGKGEAWRARGAEVAIASLDDRAAVTAALAGAAGAYLLVPPNLTAADPLAVNRALVDGLAAAVAAAQVPHVTLLSSVGAHHPDGTGPIQWLHHAESALAAVAPLTAIRAAYFLENWAGALGQVADGVLPTFLPPAAPLPMVATVDIGRVAAAALREGPRGNLHVELAGPRELSPDDVAAAVSELAGRPVKAVAAPLEAVVPVFTGFGMSPAMAGLFAEMYGAIASGRVAYAGDGRRVRGTTTVAEVLRPLVARA